MDNKTLVLGFLAAGACLLALLAITITPSFEIFDTLKGEGQYYSAQVYGSLDGKIIYMSDIPLNPESFMADCERRKGVFGREFDSCGTICVPLSEGREECVDACVYSCEFKNKN